MINTERNYKYQSNNPVDTALDLPEAKLGLIPGTTYGPPDHQKWAQRNKTLVAPLDMIQIQEKKRKLLIDFISHAYW